MDRKQRLREVLRGLIVIILAGTCLLFVSLKFGIGIPCVFYQLTGLMCPGCGMTRAISELWKGDVENAIRYNALSVSVLPAMVLYLGYRSIRYINGKHEGFYLWEYIFLILLLIATIGYCIWHNIISY